MGSSFVLGQRPGTLARDRAAPTATAVGIVLARGLLDRAQALAALATAAIRSLLVPRPGLGHAENAAVVALALETAQGGFQRFVRTYGDLDQDGLTFHFLVCGVRRQGANARMGANTLAPTGALDIGAGGNPTPGLPFSPLRGEPQEEKRPSAPRTGPRAEGGPPPGAGGSRHLPRRGEPLHGPKASP